MGSSEKRDDGPPPRASILRIGFGEQGTGNRQQATGNGGDAAANPYASEHCLLPVACSLFPVSPVSLSLKRGREGGLSAGCGSPRGGARDGGVWPHRDPRGRAEGARR